MNLAPGMAGFVFAAIVLLCGVQAPYGRYSKKKGWGCVLNGTLAWVVQVAALHWIMPNLSATS